VPSWNLAVAGVSLRGEQTQLTRDGRRKGASMRSAAGPPHTPCDEALLIQCTCDRTNRCPQAY